MSKKKNEEALKIKIILIGDHKAGKTSIINRYYENKFTFNTMTTVAMNFVSKKLFLNQKKIIANIWDTAGQERFKSVNKLFIKESDIVIFVYDITNKTSFENLQFWYKFIIDELGESPYFALAGNKIDLYENEEVTEEEGEKLANEWDANFGLISAKEDNNGVSTFFEDTIKKYLEKNEGQEDEIVKYSIVTLKEYDKDKIVNEDNGCCNSKKKSKIGKKIKMVFLGENEVGKTYIVERIVGKEINTKYEHTTKIIKYKKKYKLENNRTIDIQIIDTNGDSINNNSDLKDYVKNAKIFFLVFDINNKDTFYKLINFAEDIQKYHKKKSFLLFLLGNEIKALEDNNSYITNEEAVQFAKQVNGQYEMVPIDDSDYFKNFINNYVEKYLQSK